jgi:hypothetical protein
MLCERLRRIGARVSIRGDLSEIRKRYPFDLALA